MPNRNPSPLTMRTLACTEYSFFNLYTIGRSALFRHATLPSPLPGLQGSKVIRPFKAEDKSDALQIFFTRVLLDLERLLHAPSAGLLFK